MDLQLNLWSANIIKNKIVQKFFINCDTPCQVNDLNMHGPLLYYPRSVAFS